MKLPRKETSGAFSWINSNVDRGMAVPTYSIAYRSNSMINHNKLSNKVQHKIYTGKELCECGKPALFQSVRGRLLCNESPNRCEAVKNKKSKTFLERYGSTSVGSSKELQEKRRKLFQQNYGVDNPMFVKEFKEKVRDTCLEKYGVEYSVLDDLVKKKSAETMILRYGVKHAAQSEKFQKKMIDTMLTRYGVRNAIHLPNRKTNCISRAGSKWLDLLGVAIREHRLIINENIFKVDGFDPLTNTIYEYLGRFWHGHPKYFDPMLQNPKVLRSTFGQLYEKTKIRIDLLRNNGFTVIAMWDDGSSFTGNELAQYRSA
jgi:hypothetical protein